MSEQNDSTNSLFQKQPLFSSDSGDPQVDKDKTWLNNNPTDTTQDVNVEIPSKMGRYEVRGLLGHGAFGYVLLAHDADLDRLVALKIPRLDRFRSKDSLQSFLDEAKTVARLRHPGIVVVHDVGQESQVPYIVMEYIRGRSLSDYLRLEKVSYKDAAKLVRQIADALAHAHNEGFVHRDLKPANILLDNEDVPRISDFGLALRYRDATDFTNRRIGTPQYMAPEQAAGENHRIDERTDIWALGAIFYLALCGRKPFAASDVQQLQDQIIAADYVALSHWDPKIPHELQRICERCMARRMTDRYRYANDLVIELDEWLHSSQRESDSGSDASSDSRGFGNSVGTTLVPRGLRPFEPQDMHIFSKLLPGPWDREGCNSTLRFLKTSIEQTDPEQAFSVGLLYGPSGSGKSSMVRAAVIPRITRSIKVIYVDAIAANMEQRLKRALLRQFEGIPKQPDLAEILFTLREEESVGDSGKVLLVIDQFEQWLARGQVTSDCELVRALRQCDGGRLQCLLMVRDDFWLPICRFMNLLECTIVDGQNACLIDAFDVDHARKVLVELGVAHGCLPENRNEITAAQNAFLDRSIAELTEDDRLFPIRLTVFVEMVRKQPWQLSTLDRLGGVGGIGVAFLEHMIGSQASSARQIYTEAARNVFSTLLPAGGLIKGSAVKREVLLNASGYQDSPRDFDQLMRLLDTELRLLTPLATDDDVQSSDSQSSSNDAEPRFQLTHDFLIPSIREWLDRDLRSTPAGRLQLMLQEQADLWSSRPSARYLPSIVEWLQYTFRTNRRSRTEPQRRMLHAATQRIRNHVLIGGVVFTLIACIGFFTYEAIRRARLNDQSKVLASALQEIEIRDVPQHVEKMQSLWMYVEPLVRATYEDEGQSIQRRSRAAVALLKVSGEPSSRLAKWLLNEQLPPEDFKVALLALAPHAHLINEELSSVLDNQAADPSTRLRAVAALAEIGDPNSRVLNDLPILQEISQTLLHQPYPEAMLWIDALRPMSSQLSEPLKQATLKAEELESARIGIAAIHEYSNDPMDIVELLPLANDFQFRSIVEQLRHSPVPANQRVSEAFERFATNLNKSQPTTEQSQTQANLAIAALTLGNTQPILKLASRSTLSPGREYLIHFITPSRLDFGRLRNAIEEYADHPSLVATLLLASSKYSDSTMSNIQSREWLQQLNHLYLTSNDREVHSIAGLLLRKRNVDTSQIDAQLAMRPREPEREWYVDSFGQTMIVFDKHETSDLPSRPAYSFAISSTEVVLELFFRFFPDHRIEPGTRSGGIGSPVTQVQKSRIAEFCNLLSRDAGIDASQWCYPVIEEATNNFAPFPDCLNKSGYRLATVEELTFILLTSSEPGWLRGAEPAITQEYVWSRSNGQNFLRPVAQLLPNPFGVFDVYGNASEIGMELQPSQNNLLNVSFRMLGGNALSPVTFDSTELSGFPTDPQVRDMYGGFRVVRTLSVD